MKTEELTAIGLTEEQATQVLAMNGRDIEKHKKTITTLETERDGLKEQLDTAQTTLKNFEGIDPTKIQQEIQSYKQQAEDAEKRFSAQITQRDQKDWINAKLDEYGVKSPLARKQIATEVMSEKDGLKWKPAEDGKPGSFFGFDDYMKAAKEEDTTLYQTAEEREAAEKADKLKDKAPTFTGPTGDPTPKSDKYTPPKIF